MHGSDHPDGRQIQSLHRAFSILEAVADRDGARVTELARSLDLSKSTVHHYLSTLRHHSYVVQEGETYHPGLGMLTLAGRVRSRREAFERHRQRVDELSNRADETAQLVVEENGEGVYLYQSTVRHTSIDTHLGTRVGLHSSAAGKAILAQLSDEGIHRILADGELERFTPNTIVDPDELLSEIEQVREQGVAFDDCEQFEGIRCVAGPIGMDDDYSAAISITAPVEEMDDARFRNEVPSLVKFLDKRAVYEKEGM